MNNCNLASAENINFDKIAGNTFKVYSKAVKGTWEIKWHVRPCHGIQEHFIFGIEFR